MRNRILLLVFIGICFIGRTQDFSVKVNVVKKIKISATERDSYVVPSGQWWEVTLTDGTRWRNNGGLGWVEDTGGGSDGNDFLTGVSMTGEIITFNVANQTNPTLDVSSLVTEPELSVILSDSLDTIGRSFVAPLLNTGGVISLDDSNFTKYNTTNIYADGNYDEFGIASVRNDLFIGRVEGGLPVDYFSITRAGDGGIFFKKHESNSHGAGTTIVDSYRLNYSGMPTLDNDLTDKEYVDDAITTAVGGISSTDDQTAAEVSITDSGGHFTSTDVEGALAETSKVNDVDITSVTPSITDSNKGDIIYLKNENPISIDEPIGTFSDGDYITYVQDSTGILEFNFKDISKNIYKKTNEEGAVVLTHYMGSGWRFNCGLCEAYDADLIKTYSPDTYWDASKALEADGIAVPSYSDYGANSNVLIAANAGIVNIAADGVKELDLDGINDNYNASAPASLDFLPTDTFWIIFQLGENLGGSDQFILHKGGTASSITTVQYGIYQSGSAIEANVGGVVSSQGAAASAEDIYVIQSDGTNTTIHINGVLADTIVNGAYTNTGADVTVGARSGGGSKFFSGSIRRIAMKKNATLTSQQITDLNAVYNP